MIIIKGELTKENMLNQVCRCVTESRVMGLMGNVVRLTQTARVRFACEPGAHVARICFTVNKRVR
jgi:hypothetical protein